MPRHLRHGFTLLATLATILLLATLVLTLQTRSQSNLRLMARLTTDLQDQAARDGLHDRLRGLVADAMAGGLLEGRPGLDGVPFAMTEGGRKGLVRV
jgi:type II secretory pathway component PulJ